MNACLMAPSASVQPNGYARRGKVLLHREALASKLGRPIAPGMDACHACDNRACVNPEHLYEGTRKQNMADCTARGRHNKPWGETHWRAKFSREDVAAMRLFHKAGETNADIARSFGADPSYVGRIVNGRMRTVERPAKAVVR